LNLTRYINVYKITAPEVIQMKIVIASDSYKGTNTSLKVAGLIETGARRVFPDAEYVKIPIADGGEGTVEALVTGLGGSTVRVAAEDALGRRVNAFYGIVAGKAVLEMAAASGLPLLKESEKNPRITSTYGTGQVLLAALEAGFRDITIGIGGSATNDGGAGLAQALGFRLKDSRGKEIPRGGAALADLAEVDASGVTPLLREVAIHVACDVNNPLLGESGASAVYGPQKGADPAMVKELDRALTRFADVVEAWKGFSMRDIPGSGAAGGLGFGLTAFCDADVKSGIETILDLVDFERVIKGADLVITGEGKIDGQSVRGKVPIGVAARVKSAGIPVLAVVGDIGEGASAVYGYGIDSIMSTVDRAMPLEVAISRSAECLVDGAERACRMIRIGMRIAGR
jgi:glycerate kinase